MSWVHVCMVMSGSVVCCCFAPCRGAMRGTLQGMVLATSDLFLVKKNALYKEVLVQEAIGGTAVLRSCLPLGEIGVLTELELYQEVVSLQGMKSRLGSGSDLVFGERSHVDVRSAGTVGSVQMPAMLEICDAVAGAGSRPEGAPHCVVSLGPVRVISCDAPWPPADGRYRFRKDAFMIVSDGKRRLRIRFVGHSLALPLALGDVVEVRSLKMVAMRGFFEGLAVYNGSIVCVDEPDGLSSLDDLKLVRSLSGYMNNDCPSDTFQPLALREVLSSGRGVDFKLHARVIDIALLKKGVGTQMAPRNITFAECSACARPVGQCERQGGCKKPGFVTQPILNVQVGGIDDGTLWVTVSGASAKDLFSSAIDWSELREPPADAAAWVEKVAGMLKTKLAASYEMKIRTQFTDTGGDRRLEARAISVTQASSALAVRRSGRDYSSPAGKGVSELESARKRARIDMREAFVTEGSPITEKVMRTVVGAIAASESVEGVDEIMATYRDRAKVE